MEVKIQYLLALFLITTQLLFGQDKERIQLGVNLASNWSIQIFEDSNHGEGNSQFNFSGGIDLRYIISEKVELSTGLAYSNIRIDQRDYNIIFPCDYTTSGFTSILDGKKSYINDKVSISYLGIPLSVKRKLFGGVNHYFITIGGEALFKVNEKYDFHLKECNLDEIDISEDRNLEAKRFISKARLSIGYEFMASKSVRLRVEPQIEYSLTKVFKDTGNFGIASTSFWNNSNLLELGILLGISF